MDKKKSDFWIMFFLVLLLIQLAGACIASSALIGSTSLPLWLKFLFSH